MRGSRRCSRCCWREQGSRGRFGKLNPALLPRRGPLAAPQLRRSGWASVLPAQGTLGWVPSGELSAFGEPAERARPRAAETLRGREVPRDFSGWLLENRM